MQRDWIRARLRIAEGYAGGVAKGPDSAKEIIASDLGA